MFMNYGSSVKEGFRVVNRRWQLVLIRIVASIINCAAFFIIVGIPLFIAIMVAGVELATTNAGALLAGLKDAFLRGYFAISILVLTSILLYITFAAFLWLYVLSGSMGIVARELTGPGGEFSLKTFFAEARKHFMPLTRFYTLVGLGIMLVSIVIGVAVGGAVYLTEVLKDASTFLGLILGVVLNAFVVLLAIFALFGSVAVSTFGAGIVIMEGEKAWPATKKTIKFLERHPQGFWAYSTLLIGYFVISVLLLAFSYPFRLLPIIGTIIVLPYQLIAYGIERYFGLGLIGSAFSYYLRYEGGRTSGAGPVPPQAPEGPAPQAEAGPEAPSQTPPQETA